MQRYSVTIVAPMNATDDRITLAIPFQPTALVQAFVDELWRRVLRNKITVSPSTRCITLHLHGDIGAIIDCEDVLGDVVDPKEKLFAVFTGKADELSAASTEQQLALDQSTLTVRIITPAHAKTAKLSPVIQISVKATIRQLHNRIAEHLGIRSKLDKDPEMQECNCKLATDLVTTSHSLDHCLVVHGKSVVERLPVKVPTHAGLREMLRLRFGADIEARKRVHFHDAVIDDQNAHTYIKLPVVQICSKVRHLPWHARVTYEEEDEPRCKLLDLHTIEQPIHPACMDFTIEESGLRSLARDDVIDIYAVQCISANHPLASIGKSSIYRSRAHWEPPVAQSDRGVAIFLSSLRVLVSLLQDMKEEESAQDAVLHMFDLLTGFPPAVRAMHILMQGNTINFAESAALSHASFEVLNGFLPTAIIGTDQSRVFEGARPLFGFILDKACGLKLTADEGATMPYLAAFQSLTVQDCKTDEPIMSAILTNKGLIEADLFKAFTEGGVLHDSPMQSSLVRLDLDISKKRQMLLSGGISQSTTVFSARNLAENYRYTDGGNVSNAIDVEELSDLNHLAELAGRNKLAVYKPAQLASAIEPCLTFDSNAQLSVYTGEQPCGTPGKSSLIFRPMHGEETIDTAIVEQLIAPILQSYKSDGTAMFDIVVGAAVKKLEDPDEIIIFAVDLSSSMQSPTDFFGVNSEGSENSITPSHVEPHFYNGTNLDDLRERLCTYEGFSDMVAIVSQVQDHEKRIAAIHVLDILRCMLHSEIETKSETLEDESQQAARWHHLRLSVARLESELKQVKGFWAALKTHEEAICDFLIYRSSMLNNDIARRWIWSMNDRAPTVSSVQLIPRLPEDITNIPHNVRCPISHAVMEDAVIAEDGCSYSAAAIQRWFNIRTSSPRTGLDLNSTTVESDRDTCEAAKRWIDGIDLPDRSGGEAKRVKTTKDVIIHFDSKVGTFERAVSPSLTLKDLYKLAFRGLRGKFVTFELSLDRLGPLTPSEGVSIAAHKILSGDRIAIRIAEDNSATGESTNSSSTGYALIKVFEHSDSMSFAYWVSMNNLTSTMVSIIWKYWRYQYETNEVTEVVTDADKRIWADVVRDGDNWITGSTPDNADVLRSWLNRHHCSGTLTEEPVFKASTTSFMQNVPLVLKVQILDKPPANNCHKLTRLDVLKQMFEASINRIHAYNYKTHIGLITFATSCRVVTPITHVLENFRQATRDMEAKGDTALWDALSLARHEHIRYGTQFPNAKKRIIVISDGQDTKSGANTSPDLCWNFWRDKIVVDTVLLGNASNVELRTLSRVLGSYAFQPTSLENALSICELETFLSLSERAPVQPLPGLPRSRAMFTEHFFRMRSRVKPTAVTKDKVPPRRQHPNLKDSFVELTKVQAKATPNSALPGGNRRSNLRNKRLMNEISRIANADHPTYDIYLSESDISFFKIVMAGPEGSPYQEGSFVLFLHADETYPAFAPKARFITKIQHPNINMRGRICVSLLDRDWTSDTSLTTLLDTIYGLLLQPERSDPINTTTTLSYHHDEVEFAEEVREHVKKYAAKTRAKWREEILNGDDLDDDHNGEDSDEEDEDDEQDMDEYEDLEDESEEELYNDY